MEEIIQVLNDLVRKGIIEKYAIGGAVGVIFYTETLNTKDVEVFVAPQIMESGIIHLGLIYEHLKKAGHKDVLMNQVKLNEVLLRDIL